MRPIRKRVFNPFLFLVGFGAQACGALDPPSFADATAQRLSLEDASNIREHCDRQPGGVTYNHNLNVICIRGPITEGMSEQFSELASKMNPKYARIFSDGGLMHAGLDMADTIETLSIDVIVGDRCFSSCAQFLFIGGNAKYLLPNSILAFHGGPIPDSRIDSADISDDQKSILRRLQHRFREFYRTRGISMDMVTKPPPRIQEQIDAGAVVFWTWTATELTEFGVDGIIELK